MSKNKTLDPFLPTQIHFSSVFQLSKWHPHSPKLFAQAKGLGVIPNSFISLILKIQLSSKFLWLYLLQLSQVQSLLTTLISNTLV